MRESAFALTQTTKGKLPRLPFKRIKEVLLGKKYTLSLVFVGDKRGATLYKQYKKKKGIFNVLSFPLSKTSGEIFINPHQAKREAQTHNMTPKTYIGYLFIHGLLHLKGYTHGSTMEREEAKLIRKHL